MVRPSDRWVGGEGPMGAMILIVGQSPGRAEARLRRPFAGPAGQMLDECLREAGIDRETVRLENALPYPILGPHKVDPEELKRYVPRLFRRMALMPNLRVVVALGNDAMRALARKSGIKEKRGEEIDLALPSGVKLLPTYHPSYVLRARHQRPTLVQDLVRARKLANGEELLLPAPEPFFGDMLDVIDRDMISLDRPIALDVETNEHDRPRLFALGNHPDQIAVVPVDGGFPEAFTWSDDHALWLGHNLNADLRWLRMIGVEVGPHREDTMLMAHLLNENRSVGLKKLALELLDPEIYWRYVEPRLKRPETRGAIPYEELGRYCANDVAATLLIYDVLQRQLAEEPELERVYRHISLPLSAVLLEAETAGVPFDRDGAGRLIEEYVAELAVHDAELNALVGGDVNWSSWQQVSAVLYGQLGLTKPPKASPGGTDEKTLMKLRDAHPLVPILLRRRKVQKKRSIVESMMKQEQGGRLYPHYNVAGPATGRLSCHDPNMQQVPTDDRIRALILARPGFVIVAADYSTLEIGVGAWQFGADDLLAAYLTGDVHTATATALLGRPPADKHERKKYGKTPNFGLLYQQGDDGFREYAAKSGLEMTREEAADLRARWHTLYPGVRAGWRRIGLAMKASGGTVVAPSGRRRRLPEFLSTSPALVNEAWRQGCNFPVQCTAAEITHVAAILSQPRLKADFGADLILHVHDSLVFEVPVARADEAAAMLEHLMVTAVPGYFERYLDVKVPIPLRVDVGIGPSWGGLTTAEEWIKIINTEWYEVGPEPGRPALRRNEHPVAEAGSEHHLGG